MKNINVEDRLIFALDVPEINQAKDIVTELNDSVNFYNERIARLSEKIDPDFLDERAREILGVQESGEEVYYY